MHPSFSNRLYKRFKDQFLSELKYLSSFSNISIDIPNVSPHDYQFGKNYQIIANQSSTVAELACLGIKIFAHGQPPLYNNAYHSFNLFSHPYLDNDMSNLSGNDLLEARKSLAIADFHRSRHDQFMVFSNQIFHTNNPISLARMLSKRIRRLNHVSFISFLMMLGSYLLLLILLMSAMPPIVALFSGFNYYSGIVQFVICLSLVFSLLALSLFSTWSHKHF